MGLDTFVVTCEHGGNQIPERYRPLFDGQRALLDSHRGYDAGALLMAETLSAALGAPLVASTTSRLLVDLNRSIGHRQVFSAATRGAPAQVRAKIVAEHYRPYRERVEHLVGEAVADGRRVIHLSSHSFTPELDGKVRGADVGLLYDPGRRAEAELCARWKEALAASAPEMRVRRNYPYVGSGDGLTTYLRQRFARTDYLGIELEINQSIAATPAARWAAVRGALVETVICACVN